MGEEVKQEEAKPEQKKEKKMEEKKEEPKPPSPLVLFLELHCVGCAKKIERSIFKIRGVEGVVVDMEKNRVTITGLVNAQAVCDKIIKKTKRRVEVLSPLPESVDKTTPEIIASQASELTTAELNVNMHCLACARQLKRKILKLKGVQTAETEYSSGKVKVTGTMDANELVDYVYKSTRKQVKIVPKPEEKKEEEKPVKEDKQDIKKEDKTEENKKDLIREEEMNFSDEQSMHKLMHYYQPFHVLETIPSPQLFSDENPNACCIA